MPVPEELYENCSHLKSLGHIEILLIFLKKKRQAFRYSGTLSGKMELNSRLFPDYSNCNEEDLFSEDFLNALAPDHENDFFRKEIACAKALAIDAVNFRVSTPF